MTNERVVYGEHKGKPILRIHWPDKMISRVRYQSEDDGRRKRLTIELSMMDGTWEPLRAVLMEGEVSREEHPHSFEAVADEYYQSWVLAQNKAPAAKKSFLNRFKSRFRSVPPKAFTKLHADRYVAWRSGKVSNASINREMACLKHMFSWAYDRALVSKNILSDYPKLEEQEWAGPRPTPEIAEKIFAKLDPRFVPIYTVIRETGARRGQVLILEPWMIDRERRLITFAKRTKKGKTIVAPLTREAEEAIDAVPRLEGCPYIFYNPETKTRWHDARKPWERARAAAGYPWFRARDLRPLYATELSEAGAPTKAISQTLGHSSERVTERWYIKSDQERAANRVLRVIEGGRGRQEPGTKTGTMGS